MLTKKIEFNSLKFIANIYDENFDLTNIENISKIRSYKYKIYDEHENLIY